MSEDFLSAEPISADHFSNDITHHVEEVTVEGDAGIDDEGDSNVTVHEEIIEEPAFHDNAEPTFYGSVQEEESSPLRQYQIKHDSLLREKAARSEEKHKQITAKAQADITNFYKEKALARESTEANNRVSEQQFIADLESTLANAQSWESVGNLVDLQAKPVGKDTTRMRQILVQLKH